MFSVRLHKEHSITIDKLTNGYNSLFIPIGSAVTWTYTATNTGNVPLSGISVADDQTGDTPVYLSGDTNTDNRLDLTEIWIYTAMGTAIFGQYNNTGTVSGYGPNEKQVKDSDTSDYFGLTPKIGLVKVVQNGPDGLAADVVDAVIGDTVIYTVTVTNTGNMELTDAVLTDDHVTAGTDAFVDGVAASWQDGGVGADTFLPLGTLAPDAKVIVTYAYVIVTADAVAETVNNTATVEVIATFPTPPVQEQVLARIIVVAATTEKLTASDSAVVLVSDVPLSGVPGLSLTKTVRNKTLSGTFGDAAHGLVGNVFEFKILVLNSGTTNLTGVMVHDNRATIGSTVKVNGTAKTWAAGTDGKVTETLPNPEPSKITSQNDMALVLVEEPIPEAGEGSDDRGM